MLSFKKNKKISLRICILKKGNFEHHRRRVLSAVIYKKEGSLTIEAALVLPMFLFAMLSILSILTLLLFQIRVQGVLYQKAAYLAQQAYVQERFDESEITNQLIAEIGERAFMRAGIKDASGLDFSLTDFSNRELVKLAVQYEIELPYDLFHLFHYQFMQSCIMHTWIGYENGLEESNARLEEEYVYITENSEVYHPDRECSHIRLSIKEVLSEDIKDLRNTSGGKYHSCEHCHASLVEKPIYITEDGDKYHNSLGCSGLKRIVTAIPLSEVGSRRPCMRCGR